MGGKKKTANREIENNTESKTRQKDLKFTVTIIASHILNSDSGVRPLEQK